MLEEFFANDMEVLYIVRVIVLLFDSLSFFGVSFWRKFQKVPASNIGLHVDRYSIHCCEGVLPQCTLDRKSVV